MKNCSERQDTLPILEGSLAIKTLRLMQYDTMQYDLANERLKYSVKAYSLSPIREGKRGGGGGKEIVVSGS